VCFQYNIKVLDSLKLTQLLTVLNHSIQVFSMVRENAPDSKRPLDTYYDESSRSLTCYTHEVNMAPLLYVYIYKDYMVSK